MSAIGVILIAAFIASFALLRWWRRRQRLRVTYHSLRCPIEDVRADVAIATDPAARPSRQFLAVTGCSLRSAAAFGLPERFGFLADGPPCRVRLEPARPAAVHTAEVSCRQDCVFALNATAVTGVAEPVRCSSGASDAIALAEQALGSSRMSRLLWYASV